MRRRTAIAIAALCLAVPVVGASTASAAGKSASAPGIAVATEKAGAVAKGKPFTAVVVTPPAVPDVIMAG